MRSVDLAEGISVSNVVMGLMRIDGKTDDEVRTLVRTGRDAGIDMVDHADIYGPTLHACERRWAEAMQLSPSERDAWTFQT
jgi:predicted oxidoreductase